MKPTSERVARISQLLVACGLMVIVAVGFSMARSGASAGRPYVDLEMHEMASLAEFRSEYVGDNSNTIGLLDSLPLGHHLDLVEIRDTDVVAHLDVTELEDADLADGLYTAIALMATVDNASSLTFEAGSHTYRVDRADVEERFGAPLSHLEDSDAEWEAMREVVGDEVARLVQ